MFTRVLSVYFPFNPLNSAGLGQFKDVKKKKRSRLILNVSCCDQSFGTDYSAVCVSVRSCLQQSDGQIP